MGTLAVTFNETSASISTTPADNHKTGSKTRFGKLDAVQMTKLQMQRCSVAVRAHLWHQWLGHISPRAIGILRRDPATGVKYDGPVFPCGNCHFEKHKMIAIAKKSTRELTRQGKVVQSDDMRPINPPAKCNGRSYSYVTKVTDGFTKMREVYLLRHRAETTEAVHAFNMQVAAEGYRVEILRCDKWGESAGEEVGMHRRESGIKVEYAATTTPQYTGASARDGQTLAAMTRALLRDEDFPPYMWGELMLTAAFFINSIPHAALDGDTPYSKTYNKTPDLSHFRAIRGGLLLHNERHKQKLDDGAF